MFHVCMGCLELNLVAIAKVRVSINNKSYGAFADQHAVDADFASACFYIELLDK